MFGICADKPAKLSKFLKVRCMCPDEWGKLRVVCPVEICYKKEGNRTKGGTVPMHLLFSVNRGFLHLFASCIRSIVNHGGEDHYEAYLLHSDLKSADQDRVRQAAGETVTCHFVPVDPTLFDGFPETKRYPRQIYYRLAAPLLLPGHLDRVLYLDVDTAVINPLRELYDTDLGENYFAACTHVRKFLTKVNRARLGVEEEVPYVNTGVLLMNLPVLRENLRLEDIRACANAKKHAFLLPDQDILTALYGTKICLVDAMRYNLSDRILDFYNADPRHGTRDLDWVRENTVIVHYCGRNKPWKDSYAGELGVFYQEVQG